MATFKRYQFFGREDGEVKKLWTGWYPWNCSDKPKYQLKSQGLLNEYKEE